MSYTYVIMDVSSATYAEISRKMREAGYAHAFNYERGNGAVIDMHGIAVRDDGSPSTTKTEFRATNTDKK